MALRFMDGFDYYPTADFTFKWSSGLNVGIQSSVTRFSSGQALNTSSVGNIKKILDLQSTWIIGMAFRAPSFATAGFIMELAVGSTRVADLWLSTGGILSVIAYDSSNVGHTLCTGTHILNAATWYFIEWKFQIGATINVCNSTVKVAGITECSFAATSAGNTIAATTTDSIILQGPATGNYYFDDLYVNDTSGSHNNDFLGDIRIEAIRPSGAGYQTDWTPDSGSNYARVNETTENGDTSYVASSTANQIDSYAMGDLLTTPSNIYAVQATVVARKTDAGTKTFDILTRISSTNYLSSDFSVQDSYNFFTQIMELSPATSAAWTASEVNGMEMGVKLIT